MRRWRLSALLAALFCAAGAATSAVRHAEVDWAGSGPTTGRPIGRRAAPVGCAERDRRSYLAASLAISSENALRM